MNDIHKMFVEGDQEIVRQATVGAGRTSLCWYPSSDFDFRHIRLLEEEAQMRGGRGSLLYIHTDMHLRRRQYDETEYKEWLHLEASERLEEKLKVVHVAELQPKIRIDRCTKAVYNFAPGKDTGRVFLLELDAEVIGRRISVPILYFVSENLVFLVHFLLRNHIKLDTLVHIKDGGKSFGGSCRTMDFIYQVADILELKRVICDNIPENRLYDYEGGCRVLRREVDYFNRKMRAMGEDAHIKYRGFSKSEICDTWNAELIEFGKIRARGKYENTYYDWRGRMTPPKNG